MVTWFLNLLQGDFASNPTAWIDLLITIAGIVAAPITWFINSRKAKKDAETAQGNFDKQLDAIRGQRDEARKQAEAQKKVADSLRSQVNLLERQVKALETQASLAEREKSVPRWDFMQARPRSVTYLVVNNNAFDAFDVRVEYNDGESYRLGDLPKGSSTSFDFMESGFWGGVHTDIIISWLPSRDSAERLRHRMAMPARL